MNEDAYQLYNNGDRDELIDLLTTLLETKYDYLKTDVDRVGAVKWEAGRDLPHDIVSEIVGCPIEICRRVRYRPGYGPVDTHGGDRRSIPPSVRRRVAKKTDGKCVRCGSDDEIYVHHIIPVSHGGLPIEYNLTLLCDECHYASHLGDTSSRRVAYRSIGEFWERFVDG